MAVFSTNQNRQFFVVKQVVQELPSTPGDLQIISKKEGDKGGFVTFKYMGPKGLVRTDLIDIASVAYGKYTKYSDNSQKQALKKATITLSSDINGGAPIAGQDYIVRIVINNYLAPGDGNVSIRYGAVHAYTGMTTEMFYEELAKSLKANFSRDAVALLDFEYSESGVVVKELEQPYSVGFMAQEPVNFEVIPTTVVYEGDEVIWATLDENKKIPLVQYATIGNGPKIADLEYFAMGERGDQYRDWVAGPNRIPVKYMVDPKQNYNIIDIHYSFSDTGVNSQKSEKEITFVSTGSLESTLGIALHNMGFPMQGLEI